MHRRYLLLLGCVVIGFRTAPAQQRESVEAGLRRIFASPEFFPR
jgi:hypothetical protein